MLGWRGSSRILPTSKNEASTQLYFCFTSVPFTPIYFELRRSDCSFIFLEISLSLLGYFHMNKENETVSPLRYAPFSTGSGESCCTSDVFLSYTTTCKESRPSFPPQSQSRRPRSSAELAHACSCEGRQPVRPALASPPTGA